MHFAYTNATVSHYTRLLQPLRLYGEFLTPAPTRIHPFSNMCSLYG
ncbi:protein of unknown function [Denitratisoma oestradiolicum]|uniref:Uncharacterized protein n=1 Tax=Denitratisoma oestradiolicum TaxID=311182 RepID=A0A6S6XXI2_9PROT|nr:protein of unknown function [Denitratisoma oestradiolicum]